MADQRNGDELLDETQAAALSGMSIGNLRWHRKRGTGPRFVRVGARQIIYRTQDVQDWIVERAAQRGAA